MSPAPAPGAPRRLWFLSWLAATAVVLGALSLLAGGIAYLAGHKEAAFYLVVFPALLLFVASPLIERPR